VLRRYSKFSIVLLTATALALPGCVTTRDQRIGANDGSDRCYAYRLALDSTGNYFAEDMIQGAAIGAIGGALIGGLATGSARGAIVGGLSGLAVGALGGYWNSKLQQGRDQAITGTLSDLRAESTNLQKTQEALNQLVNCRRGEIATVKADLKAKRITREEAESRMSAIRVNLAKDYEIASSIDKNITKRNDEYLFAVDQVQPGSSDKIRTAVKKPSKPSKTAKPANDTVTAMYDQTMSNTLQKEGVGSTVQVIAGLEKETTL